MENIIDYTIDNSISDVKHGLNTFIVAMKNFTFYPETNELRKQSLAGAMQWFTAYMAENGSLTLEVEETSFLHEGEEVYADKSHDHSIAFPMFRDGISSITFDEGLTVEELETFINICNRFRVMKEDSDDDIVSAMWEADFQFISYQTGDQYWGGDSQVDLSNLKVRPSEETEGGFEPQHNASDTLADILESFEASLVAESFDSQGEAAEAGGGSGLTVSQPNSPVETFEAESLARERFWHFNEEDQQRLRALIGAEARRAYNSDCMDVILTVLVQLRDEYDPEPLLHFLADVVRHGLADKEFAAVRRLIEAMGTLSGLGKPWLSGLMSKLTRKIVQPEVLEGLAAVWPQAHHLSQEQLMELHKVLLLWPPDAAYILVPVLAKRLDPNIENLILSVVATHVCQLNANTATLLAPLEPRHLLSLIGIITNHLRKCPVNLYAALAKHQASKVRGTAARALLEDSPDNAKHVFHLLDDLDNSVRNFIFSWLGRVRHTQTERLIIGQLERKYESSEEELEVEKLLNYYRLLGQCGSDTCLRFIENVLLKKSWKAMLGIDKQSFHRQGAALTLMLLPRSEKVQRLVSAVAESRDRNVRQAWQQAESEMKQMGAANGFSQ